MTRVCLQVSEAMRKIQRKTFNCNPPREWSTKHKDKTLSAVSGIGNTKVGLCLVHPLQMHVPLRLYLPAVRPSASIKEISVSVKAHDPHLNVSSHFLLRHRFTLHTCRSDGSRTLVSPLSPGQETRSQGKRASQQAVWSE